MSENPATAAAPDPTPASAEYARFLASVEGVEPQYREELDMDALLALKEDERRAAEDMMIERVKEVDDWRVRRRSRRSGSSARRGR